MKIFVQIMDDAGNVVAEHDADAYQPSRWNAPSDKRFVSKIPQQSDKESNRSYELFGITIQPHTAPASSPASTGFPGLGLLPDYKARLAGLGWQSKPISSWDKSFPTSATQASNPVAPAASR